MGTYFYMPRDLAVVPASGECITDHWWTCHPEKGLLLWTFRHKPPPLAASDGDVRPQCNRDRRICEFLIRKIWRDGSHEAVLMPVVYMAHARPLMVRALEEKISGKH